MPCVCVTSLTDPVSPYVLSGALPHVVLTYGAWMCPNVLETSA
jgi:hypothetical protein